MATEGNAAAAAERRGWGAGHEVIGSLLSKGLGFPTGFSVFSTPCSFVIPVRT